MLAGGGRFVIRYDHRDTGRSITYEPGQAQYTGADLTADAVGVLDGFGISAAHLVGVSAGGGIAQEVALDSADRVLSLTLISTSPVTPGDRDLPPPTAELGRFVATADWSNPYSVIDYLVDYSRILAGRERAFDETRIRELVRRDVERARDFAAVQNHDLMSHGEGSPKPLSSITAPTLVIHGTADPGRRWRGRSPPLGCCHSKARATRSIERTGSPSPARSSNTPVRWKGPGDMSACERTTAAAVPQDPGEDAGVGGDDDD
jgi:pimeloyl-ACP methyl ester carboxylesterase